MIALRPPRSDALVALALTAVSVVALALQPLAPDQGVTRPFDTLGVALSVLSTAAVAWRRTAPRAAMAMAGPPALIATAVGYGVTFPDLAVWVLTGSTALHTDARQARALTAIGAAAVAGSVYVISPDTRNLLGLLTAAAVGALPPLIGDALRRQRELVDEVRHLRDAEVERAASEERVRIARDVHDTVGHHLAAIGLQARAGELDAARVDAARQTLRTIADLSDRALADTGAILGVLRRADPSDLDALARTTSQAGLPVSTCGTLAGLPDEHRDCAFRVAQEALTNAARHARASAAQVDVRREADRLRLSVVDDGRAPATAERRRPGAGLGIAGMRERARALGGTLAAGPRPDGHPGWQVLLELPLS